jgi:hypothetical protein
MGCGWEVICDAVARCRVVRVRAGAYLYRTGQADDRFYMVHSGTLQRLTPPLSPAATTTSSSSSSSSATAPPPASVESPVQVFTAGSTFGHELVYHDQMRAKPAKPKRNINKLWEAARRRSMLYSERVRRAAAAGASASEAAAEALQSPMDDALSDSDDEALLSK